MLEELKNQLVIHDKNNDEIHHKNFNCLCSLYDGELIIIDTREMGYMIAEDLESEMQAYGWDEIEIDDAECAIEDWIIDITTKLRERINEVCYENNIPIEEGL